MRVRPLEAADLPLAARLRMALLEETGGPMPPGQRQAMLEANEAGRPINAEAGFLPSTAYMELAVDNGCEASAEVSAPCAAAAGSGAPPPD